MRMHIDMHLSGVNKIWKERMKIQQAFTLYVCESDGCGFSRPGIGV